MSSLNDPLEKMAFDDTTLRVLHAAGIHRVGDFAGWSWRRIRKLPSLGHKRLDRIDAVLAYYDLDLPETDAPSYVAITPPVQERSRSEPKPPVSNSKHQGLCEQVSSLIMDGCRTVAEIAAAMSAKPSAIYRILRLPEFEYPFIPCEVCKKFFRPATLRDRLCSDVCVDLALESRGKAVAPSGRLSAPARHDKIRALIVQGANGRQIAEALGVTYQYVYMEVNRPAFYYPEVACEACGKPFVPTAIKDKLCSVACQQKAADETKKRKRKATTRSLRTPEERAAAQEKLRQERASPEYRARASQMAIERWADEAYRKKQQEAKARIDKDSMRTKMAAAARQRRETSGHSRIPLTASQRERQAQIALALWQNEEFRQKQSQVRIRLWQDPAYRAKQTATRQSRQLRLQPVIGNAPPAQKSRPPRRRGASASLRQAWEQAGQLHMDF